jgi:VanZ family protein
VKKIILWVITFAWAYYIFYLTSIPNYKVVDNDILGLLISSSGHFIFFGIQSILLFLALPQKLFLIPAATLAVIFTSLFGIFDELHQLRVVGRSADPIDWILDTLGAIIFLVILNKLIIKYKLIRKMQNL